MNQTIRRTTAKARIAAVGRTPRKTAVTGYILHETADVVVIATIGKSSNAKTGNMVQTYILYRWESPVAAVRSGKDKNVCGNCIHMKNPVTGKRTCYVNLGQGPLAVWKKYLRGGYGWLAIGDYEQVFGGRKIRLGTYGDPALIPLEIVVVLVRVSSGATGYTHMWLLDAVQVYQPFFMASCDSDGDYEAAKALGWCTFQVIPSSVGAAAAAAVTPSKLVVCLSESVGRHCHECLLCNGMSRPRAKDVVITAHGASHRAFQILQ